ncbi:MAG: putative zinc-binding protein [Phycisphaerae bacterium]|nr:putative zinc-binding protein [Phycisphaerae bacterium]
MANKCCAAKKDKLIFSCSGAADVGELSDRVARKMTSDGIGKMFCLAGIGGKVAPIMQTTVNAAAILAIDGCGLNCVKNSLKEAGIYDFQHLLVTDLGFVKGETDVCDANIEKLVTAGTAKLG